MILIIEPWIYWTLLALLVANLLTNAVKTWVLRRAIAKQYTAVQKQMPPECEGKDPRGCWNVRCQLGDKCCRSYEFRKVES